MLKYPFDAKLMQKKKKIPKTCLSVSWAQSLKRFELRWQHWGQMTCDFVPRALSYAGFELIHRHEHERACKHLTFWEAAAMFARPWHRYAHLRSTKSSAPSRIDRQNGGWLLAPLFLSLSCCLAPLIFFLLSLSLCLLSPLCCVS